MNCHAAENQKISSIRKTKIGSSDHFEFSAAGPLGFLVPNSKRFGNIKHSNLVNYILASLVLRIYLFFESDSIVSSFSFLAKLSCACSD